TAVGTQNDGALSIACMGPNADLWVHQCILVDITGDMFGQIHLPELAAYEIIRIGGRFGDLRQITDDPFLATMFEGLTCSTTEELHYTGDDTAVTEDSPRGFWWDVEDYNHNGRPWPAIYSGIFVREPNGLRGPVILDALNTDGLPRPRYDWTLG